MGESLLISLFSRLFELHIEYKTKNTHAATLDHKRNFQTHIMRLIPTLSLRWNIRSSEIDDMWNMCAKRLFLESSVMEIWHVYRPVEPLLKSRNWNKMLTSKQKSKIAHSSTRWEKKQNKTVSKRMKKSSIFFCAHCIWVWID